jgi:hypothetical protein
MKRNVMDHVKYMVLKTWTETSGLVETHVVLWAAPWQDYSESESDDEGRKREVMEWEQGHEHRESTSRPMGS